MTFVCLCRKSIWPTFRVYLLSGLLVLTIGCSQWKTQKELERLSSTEILIPSDMEVILNGKLSDSLSQAFIGKIKLVVYYSDEGCTPCRVSHLRNEELFFEIDSLRNFTPVIIFSPQDEQYNGLRNLLRLNPFQFPVFIDRSRGFIQNNDCIPTDSRFHTFLLDKNNRVVLVGNPLAGETMWKLFKSTLDNMLAHDGIYVAG